MIRKIKHQKMSKKNQFLVNHKLSRNVNISKVIHKSLKIITKWHVTKILVHNKYEKLIPFNLWFKHSMYEISNCFENNQNIRIRYFGSNMLTPLITNNDNDLKKIKPFLSKLSLYQPFYPETFYPIWEFLQMGHLKFVPKVFLHIGREERLGTIEAIILYHEKYQQTYQYNIYHCWLTGKEVYNKTKNSYRLKHPKINYLAQAYKINFIKSTDELVQYDFISIDCAHLFEDIFKWPKEELDLQSTLILCIDDFTLS